MFGRFNGKRNHRNSLGRGKRQGRRGTGRNRCSRMGYGQNFHEQDFFGHLNYSDETTPAASNQKQAAGTFIAGDTTEGFCPLCKKHCPLSAPSCPKGEAYAVSDLSN